MKEATGELNMTLVTIIAIAAVLTFVTTFLPKIFHFFKYTFLSIIFTPLLVKR